MLNLRYLTVGFLSLYLSVLSISGFAQPVHGEHVAKVTRTRPVAVDDFRVVNNSRYYIKLVWNSDKKAKKFKVEVMSPFKKRTVDYSEITVEPEILLFGLNIDNGYVVQVTPIDRKGRSGPTTRVGVFKSRGLPLKGSIPKAPVFTVATLSMAAENLVNLVGDGKNPNLTITLSSTEVCNWGTGYSAPWGGNAGIPVRSSGDKCGGNGSEWVIADSVTGTYFGTVYIDDNGDNVTYQDYYKPSGGNYIEGAYILEGGGSYPELHVDKVVCGYCDATAVLINKIGTSTYPHPRIHLELSANSENTTTIPDDPASNTYNLDYYDSVSGTPKGYIPDVWSAWNVRDDNDNYFGTINLKRSQNTVTFGDPIYTAPGGTESLSNVKISLDTTKVPAEATITADVACGEKCYGPFQNAPIATAPTNFEVTTLGNQLLLNGNPLRLKGWARPSLEWDTHGQFFSTTDMVNIKNSGANVVRISMSAKSWLESEASTVNGSYKQIIDAIVYYAAQNKMMVILDYHKYTNVENGSQEPMAIKDSAGSSITFWTEVATKYKGFGHVLFELYNEPRDIAYDTWLNGDANYYGMQNLYDAVRATGAKNVVVIAGLEWSFYLGFLDETKKLCNGENCFVKDTSQPDGLSFNTIYQAHPYTVEIDGTPTYKGSTGYFFVYIDGVTQPADFRSNFAGIITKYPLMFTEFGARLPTDYQDPTYYQEAIGEMLSEANNLTLGHKGIHIMGWAWWIDPAQPEFPCDIGGEWSNPQPLNAGVQIVEDYKTNPPTDLSPYFP